MQAMDLSIARVVPSLCATLRSAGFRFTLSPPDRSTCEETVTFVKTILSNENCMRHTFKVELKFSVSSMIEIKSLAYGENSVSDATKSNPEISNG